jgi:hypothetical protein
VPFALFPEKIHHTLQNICQREERGNKVKSSRAKQLYVPIVAGKVVAIRLIIAEDISKLEATQVEER